MENNIKGEECIQARNIIMVAKPHVWQSRVEIEHYSIAYFDRTAAL